MGTTTAPGSNSNGRKRLFAVLVLISGALALLSGCMEVNLEVDLRGDGSGVLMFETVIPQQIVGFMEMTGQSMDEKFIREEFLREVPSEVADRVDLSVERSDGTVSIRIHIRFENLDELNASMADGVDSAPVFVEFDLREEGDEWVFSAVPVDTSSASDSSEIDDLFAGDDLFADPQISFTLTFSGRVIESNADRTSGRSATWNLTEAGSSRLSARAAVSGGFPIVTVGVAVTLLAILIGLVVLVVRSRSTRAATGYATGVGGPASPIGSTGGAVVSPWGAPGPTGAVSPPTMPVSPPLAPPSPRVPPAGPLAPPPPPVAPPEPAVPPMTPPQPGATAPAFTADWYPDPWGEGRWRWYDGTTWTVEVR